MQWRSIIRERVTNIPVRKTLIYSYEEDNMQVREMIYVLDSVKGCMQMKDKCEHDCVNCAFNMNQSTILDTIDRVTNLLDNISNRSTRQNF